MKNFYIRDRVKLKIKNPQLNDNAVHTNKILINRKYFS